MVMQNLGGLAPNLAKLFGGMRPGAQQSNGLVPYKRHVTIPDGDAAYDTMAEVLAIIGALAAGAARTLIWEMTVPPQQLMRWGFGSPAFPDNQGYMWFFSADIAADFQQGSLILAQQDANGRRTEIVLNCDDSQLHLPDPATVVTATPGSRLEKFPLPEKVEFPLVGEDSRLQIYYDCHVAAAAAEDTVAFSIPVTVYQR